MASKQAFPFPQKYVFLNVPREHDMNDLLNDWGKGTCLGLLMFFKPRHLSLWGLGLLEGESQTWLT